MGENLCGSLGVCGCTRQTLLLRDPSNCHTRILARKKGRAKSYPGEIGNTVVTEDDMDVLEAGPVADLGQAMALGAKVVQSSGLLGGKSWLPSPEIWV